MVTKTAPPASSVLLLFRSGLLGPCTGPQWNEIELLTNRLLGNSGILNDRLYIERVVLCQDKTGKPLLRRAGQDGCTVFNPSDVAAVFRGQARRGISLRNVVWLQ